MRLLLCCTDRPALECSSRPQTAADALSIGQLNTFSPDLVLGAREILPAERVNILAHGRRR